MTRCDENRRGPGGGQLAEPVVDVDSHVMLMKGISKSAVQLMWYKAVYLFAHVYGESCTWLSLRYAH